MGCKNKPLAKENENKGRNKQDGSPHQHRPGYALSSMKCVFFMLINYAVSISFRTIKFFEIEHNLLCKKETHVRRFSMKEIFTNRFRSLRLIFSYQTLETINC